MQTHLKSALRHLLKPLVKFLLTRGISHGEFSEETKRIMVITSREMILQESKKPTDSRVAALTGLTRKDVKRIRDQIKEDSPDNTHQESTHKASRATSVLRGWHDDPDFCDQHGYPSSLPLWESEHNFASLVKRYSGDIPVGAMREELLRLGAVSVTKDNRVHVLRRNFIPENPNDIEMVRISATAVHDLISTLNDNLDPVGSKPRKLQRSVSNTNIPVSALPVIQRIVYERGQEFLQMLDTVLSSYELNKNSHKPDQTETLRTGVGLYFFVEDYKDDVGGDKL